MRLLVLSSAPALWETYRHQSKQQAQFPLLIRGIDRVVRSDLRQSRLLQFNRL